jgi:hypothetical protein
LLELLVVAGRHSIVQMMERGSYLLRIQLRVVGFWVSLPFQKILHQEGNLTQRQLEAVEIEISFFEPM